jgi:hypothetical protein
VTNEPGHILKSEICLFIDCILVFWIFTSCWTPKSRNNNGVSRGLSLAGVFFSVLNRPYVERKRSQRFPSLHYGPTVAQSWTYTQPCLAQRLFGRWQLPYMQCSVVDWIQTIF